MKKILFAWIEQVLEFDSEQEAAEYKRKLASGRKQVYRIIEEKTLENGQVRLHIKKQYNKNIFPDD